jgi:hypothetical protein
MSNPESPAPNWNDLTRQWQDMMMGNFSTMTKEVVASDAFGAASSAALDYSLALQKQVRGQSAQFMESLEFPKRSDLARLSKQVASVEKRVLEVEEKLDEVLELLKKVATNQHNQARERPRPKK